MNRNTPVRPRRSGRWFLAVGAALLLAAAVVTLAHEGHPSLPMHGATVHGDELLLTDGALRALGIATGKVTLADLPRSVRATATIEVPWDRQAYATVLVSGVIDEVLVRPGEAVAAHQELAWLTSPHLERLQLEMLVASAEWSLAQQLLEQQMQAAHDGAIAGKVLLETRKSRDAAAARLNLASWKLHALGLTEEVLDRVRSTGKPVQRIAVRSPAAGTVAQIAVRVGQAVEPTDHLFHIVDHGSVWCVAQVLETDAVLVAPGQPVRVVFPAVPQREFPGTIDHIDLALEPQHRTVPVIIELENPTGELRSGMSGVVEIQVGVDEQVIACPTDALIRAGSRDMVLLRRGEGKYLRREVALGRRTARWAEVHSGLFPGDHVVTTGRHLLASLWDEHVGQPPTSASHRSTPRSLRAAAAESPAMPDGTIAAQGTVEVPTAAKVLATSRIDGRIRRILVHHGQHVEAGQVLAEVESLDLANLQLDLLQALTELRWKQDALARIAPLAERAAQPQAEVRRLRAEVEILQHRVDSLKRRLRWIGLGVEDIDRLERVDLTVPGVPPELPAALAVHAPQSGRVGEFLAVPGQAVAAEDPLFELHDVSRVWVKLLVFEHEAPRIELGDAVQLSFAAHPSLRVHTTIARRGAAGAAQRPWFPLWVELPNPDGLLREGMMAFAVIRGGDPSQRPLARTGPNAPRVLQE